MKIGVLGLAFIILLIAKLAGVAISWWIVVAPLLVGFALWVVIIVFICVMAAIYGD